MRVQQTIETKIQEAFSPTHLEVTNESSMHAVAPGSETHFRLLIVSVAFDGKNRVKRHQEVYRILAEEKAGPVHALGLQTLTPDEWAADQESLDSPACLGGDGSLK